jgi:hypothetical protein
MTTGRFDFDDDDFSLIMNMMDFDMQTRALFGR